MKYSSSSNILLVFFWGALYELGPAKVGPEIWFVKSNPIILLLGPLLFLFGNICEILFKFIFKLSLIIFVWLLFVFAFIFLYIVPLFILLFLLSFILLLIFCLFLFILFLSNSSTILSGFFWFPNNIFPLIGYLLSFLLSIFFWIFVAFSNMSLSGEFFVVLNFDIQQLLWDIMLFILKFFRRYFKFWLFPCIYWELFGKWKKFIKDCWEFFIE